MDSPTVSILIIMKKLNNTEIIFIAHDFLYKQRMKSLYRNCLGLPRSATALWRMLGLDLIKLLIQNQIIQNSKHK